MEQSKTLVIINHPFEQILREALEALVWKQFENDQAAEGLLLESIEDQGTADQAWTWKLVGTETWVTARMYEGQVVVEQFDANNDGLASFLFGTDQYYWKVRHWDELL